MGKVWEIDTHTFPIVWVLFSHQIPILWYTSPYEKYMCFLINFPCDVGTGKMQQSPSYRMNLGNSNSYFSHSMCIFSHKIPILWYIYFIIWEMHRFPHQCPKVQKNGTKSIRLGEPRKLVLTLFPKYRCFFPIRFPYYGILHHMGYACVFSLISQNPSTNGEGLGNWFPYFFHEMGEFFYQISIL